MRSIALHMIVAALGATSGCASALSACPEKGGRSWREISSEHFSLTTDLDSSAARETVTDLETFRAALLRSAWPGAAAQPEGRIQVYGLSRTSDFTHRYRAQVGGFFTQALYQPTIVLANTSGLAGASAIKHEMVHFLARLYQPKQTTWLSEGLAMFFETLEIDRKEREVT